jgi:dipeptidyl aminopeptidase/acylaminoacyl peptidase
LLVIDLTNGVKIHEAPSSLPVWGPSSISGAGDLVAFSEGSHVFLHELPSGKFLGQFDGGSPRISPDGRRIAYLRDERLLVRTLANRSDRILLPKSKMQGLTGWSPNGRYLLASGRTKLLALDRRYIAIDSESGEYAEIEKLWESDRGGGQTWVSAKLMNRN